MENHCVPWCALENPAGWQLLSLRHSVAHRHFRSLWVASIHSQDTLHRMEGVTRMEDILRAVCRALLHTQSHFPAPSCSGAAAYCRAVPATAKTEALLLVAATCFSCVGWWSFEILELGARDLDLPGCSFHSRMSVKSFCTIGYTKEQLYCFQPFIIIASALWCGPFFFMWLLHHTKKKVRFAMWFLPS